MLAFSMGPIRKHRVGCDIDVDLVAL
jgi:hypothetical protein